jgi:hypothetical protein
LDFFPLLCIELDSIYPSLNISYNQVEKIAESFALIGTYFQVSAASSNISSILQPAVIGVAFLDLSGIASSNHQ